MQKTKFIFGTTLFALAISLIGCNTAKKETNSGGSSESSSQTSSSSGSSSSSETQHNDFNGEKVSIHYQRADMDYSTWALWLWEPLENSGREYMFSETDDFGGVCTVALETWQKLRLDNAKGLGFIVKTKGSWNEKDVDSDRFIDFSQTTVDNDKCRNIYLLSGDSTIYYEYDESLSVFGKITSAEFTTSNQITIKASSNMVSYVVKEGDNVLGNKELSTPAKTDVFTLDGSIDFNKEYTVTATFEDEKVDTKSVLFTALYKSDDFAAAFNYDGELGAIYSSGSTTFKVWSPISKEIKLRLYNNGTPKSVDSAKGDDTYEEINMVKGEKGVWSADVNGDLEGKYYTFVVTNYKYKEVEVVDSYAKSCGVNGLRGMVVDFSKTNPTDWDSVKPKPYDRKELTVYETHVADVTSSKSWNGPAELAKTYAGMYEKNTTYTYGGVTVKTGFDHIKELGVNAVQILPIFDQANDEVNVKFNWGYNPLNYNSLEGCYSSNPYDGYVRIREFKELVKAYNEANINIIMDVVYNHMNNVGGTAFDTLMPGYYFRYNDKNQLSNGSGCGNDTASEMYMYRKFMIDSAKFWAKEYKLGGFRFDLMGLHDVTTMNQLTAACKAINPHIVIFGEPWDLDTPLPDSEKATQKNGYKYEGYGQFNDQMRDALIKGGLNEKTAKGWADAESSSNANDAANIVAGIKGFTGTMIKDPDKTTNYVTCHDNYTLYDRFFVAGISNLKKVLNMSMLANSIVFTSQGTSFMLAGEEFARTKDQDENSYQSSYLINELDYSRLTNSTYSRLYENYKKLIKLKQDVDGLHLDAEHANLMSVETNSSYNIITYEIQDTATNRTYKIVHASASVKEATANFSGYTLYLNTLNNDISLSSSTPLAACQTIIAYK